MGINILDRLEFVMLERLAAYSNLKVIRTDGGYVFLGEVNTQPMGLMEARTYIENNAIE